MLHAARICSLQLNEAEATTSGSITDVAEVWRSMHSDSGRVPSSTPERSWHPLLLSGGPPICKFQGEKWAKIEASIHFFSLTD